MTPNSFGLSLFGGAGQSYGNSIGIYYGRLHAPNENKKMIVNGEDFHAWHSFEHALHFID